MEWAVDLKPEAFNYLLDSWPYRKELRNELDRLRHTQDAIPPEGATQLEPGLILWEVANHLIFYSRVEETQKIIIWVIKPTQE